MLRNCFKAILMPMARPLAISAPVERRGYTGSKTHFYSSLGNKSYKKFRTAKSNRHVDSAIEILPHLKAGTQRFRVSLFLAP